MNRFTLGERVFPSVRRFVPTIFCRLSGDRRTTKVHPSEKGFTLVTFGQDMSVRRNKGFTLIETLIVMAILAILAGIAVPSVREAQANARIRSTAGDIAAAIAEARSQAAGRQKSVSLTADDDGWGKGWVVAFTTPVVGVPDLAAHSGVPASIEVTVDPDIDGLVFFPNGMVEQPDGNPVTEVSFTVCDDRVTGEQGRELTVTRLGRTSSRDAVCD